MFLSINYDAVSEGWHFLVGFFLLLGFLVLGLATSKNTSGLDNEAFRWVVIMLVGGAFISTFSALGVLLEVIAIALYIYLYKTGIRQQEILAEKEALERIERKEKRLKEIGGTELDRFYVECVLARCTDFSLPKNAEKAKLLAQKYRQYPPCTTEELFLEAREKHGTIANDLQKERLAKLREQENRAYRESIQYAGYQGKEKMRIMLTHSIQEHRRKIDQIVNKAASETPTLEKEHNWGVWGGIADGLAGPAAGVSTALNVQSQNAQIRERNNARLNATLGLYTLAVMDAGQIKREADYEQKVRDNLPEKLLDDKTDPKDIFKLMQIIDSNVEVSETGAFRVTASIHSKGTPKIYGDVSARIDGTILAHVYEDDRLVGTAKMVLPKLGITNKWEPIMGICLNGADPRKKQTVQFEAGNLWMIEY